MREIINIEEPIYYRHKDSSEQNSRFHLHDCFEIFYLLEGRIDYFIEKDIYSMQAGDVIITNAQEIHMPAFQQGNKYERIVLQFDPFLIQTFRNPRFNVLGCFLNRPKGKGNLRKLSVQERMELERVSWQMEQLPRGSEQGSDILKLIYLVELTVLLNNAYAKENTELTEGTTKNHELIGVLDYIDENLTGCLQLDTLEHEFHVSKYHLSRRFKECFGSTIHEYITYKRLSLAKELLMEGMSVTNACMNSGFNDYSNFLKLFKRTVGLTPGQYRSRSYKQQPVGR